jgi:hypothetical protein
MPLALALGPHARLVALGSYAGLVGAGRRCRARVGLRFAAVGAQAAAGMRCRLEHCQVVAASPAASRRPRTVPRENELVVKKLAQLSAGFRARPTSPDCAALSCFAKSSSNARICLSNRRILLAREGRVRFYPEDEQDISPLEDR